MIKEAIGKVVALENLSEREMIAVMQEIMSGEATAAQIGAFITGLRMKGETIDEIVGAVKVMREKATFIDTGVNTAGGEVLMDIVGTGGDGSGSFNVSTTTSFVVAAAGVPVAKHGNRAVSSRCGSADVLEALGVDLSMPPEKVAACVREVGIGFLFAPLLHGAMKYAIGPRREIGIRTLFNILGPMTNPAGANVQLTGVFSPDLTATLAEVLVRLGMKRAIVVWGEGNLDEMTITGATHIADGHAGRVTTSILKPEDVGCASQILLPSGAGRRRRSRRLRSAPSWAVNRGRNWIWCSSMPAPPLMAAGVVDSILAGIAVAREVVVSGAALAKLEQLIVYNRA
jgi:anthranilate phosphoribosyltransferase